MDLLASLFEFWQDSVLHVLEQIAFLLLSVPKGIYSMEAEVVNVPTLHTMEGELLTSHGSVVLHNCTTGKKAYYGIKFTYDLHLLCPCSIAWL